MIVNNHPGYIVHEIAGHFYPICLIGAAGSGTEDDKGRSLSNVVQTWGEDGEGNPFKNEDGSLVWFENGPHAHNFLNKWVRETVGLGYAEQRWNTHQSQKADEKGDLGDLQHRLAAMRAAYDMAEIIVRAVVEGTLRREEARKMFSTMTHFSENADVVEFFGDLLDEIA